MGFFSRKSKAPLPEEQPPQSAATSSTGLSSEESEKSSQQIQERELSSNSIYNVNHNNTQMAPSIVDSELPPRNSMDTQRREGSIMTGTVITMSDNFSVSGQSHNGLASGYHQPGPTLRSTPMSRSLLGSRSKGGLYMSEASYVGGDDQSMDSFSTRRKWKTSKLQPGDVYEKPWIKETQADPRRKYEKWIFAGGVLLGLCGGGGLLYQAYVGVVNSDYCMVLDDNFTTIDTNSWNYEIQRGGFGTGSFEWATSDPENVFVSNDGLHIMPTLTVNTTNMTPDLLVSGGYLNLTADGTCTSGNVDDCVVRANSSANGGIGAIVNPVRSARINTKGKRTIRYGKVEVVAKLPRGDWLWPAIWMMPEESIYGVWPRSGEIDLMESRGNDPGYGAGGRDFFSSALHWGPSALSDGYTKTIGFYQKLRSDYSNGFHTYGLEWNEKYLFFYIDSRLKVRLVKCVRDDHVQFWTNIGNSKSSMFLGNLVKHCGRKEVLVKT